MPFVPTSVMGFVRAYLPVCIILSMLVLGSCAVAPTGTERSPDDDVEAQIMRGQATVLEHSLARDTAALAAVAEPFEVHIFSIGQADSMLVIGPGPARKTMLVDVGEPTWNSRKNCPIIRERVKALTGSAKVNYLVLTHYHGDHVGGPRVEDSSGRVQGGGGLFCLLDAESEHFRIDTLIDPGDDSAELFAPTSKLHQAIKDFTPSWIASGRLGERQPAQIGSTQIDLGPGVSVDIVVATSRFVEGEQGVVRKFAQQHASVYASRPPSPNDFSVGMEIAFGDFELFTAGDLSGAPGDPPYAEETDNGFDQTYTNIESKMVAHWQAIGRESNVEVYRANHHGSGNSSTQDLANILQPELVIYSCGGSHGHPKQSIADRFLALGADQLVTTKIDDNEWGSELFPEEYVNGWSNPVGEIAITVAPGASHYLVSTATQDYEYPIRSDAQESTGF
jgi:beta-lactamase superfamily II metal-dependent hydrolase